MRLPRIEDRQILGAIEALAGDGYAPMPEVIAALPRRSHADRRRAIHRSVSRGLAIERRGPDGRSYLAIASEGWRLLREAA
jgi:hypothetical protein